MPLSSGEHQEARDQRQRYPVGNRHGEKVARGRERHQGRKQHQPRDVEDHGIHVARAVEREVGASPEHSYQK